VSPRTRCSRTPKNLTSIGARLTALLVGEFQFGDTRAGAASCDQLCDEVAGRRPPRPGPDLRLGSGPSVLGIARIRRENFLISRIFARVAAFVGGVLAAGCSSQSIGPMGSGGAGAASSDECTPIAACGGNLVGTWHVQQGCFPALAPSVSTCSSAVVTLSAVSLSGTLTYNADNTMKSALQGSFTEAAQFPNPCYTQTQCNDFPAAADAEPGVSGATCSYDATTGCACSLMDSLGSTSTGTYQVAGTNVTTTTDGHPSPPEIDNFCVSGNTLTLQSTDSDGMITTITATR
jgi:hypothetical protein